VGSISGDCIPRRTSAVRSAIVAIACAAMLWMASSAQAAELLYWDNYSGTPNSVSVANIDGSGGGSLSLAGTELKNPEGMALDPLIGKLFVASPGTGAKGQILAVNLDGSGASVVNPVGAPVETPEGVAVDPATGTLYWANDSVTPSIAWAKLDGSAGGTLNTTGATLNGPCCRVAIDPVGGRIYWINTGSIISYANLNNTGGGDLNLTGTTVAPGGEGLAVDSKAGRLYFLGGTGKIGYANVNGSGGGDVPIGSGVSNGPWGLALDPSISRLYWGNESNGTERSNAIGFVATAGGSGGGISIATAPVGGPQDPVILKSPTGTEAPTVTRSSKSRSSLSCSAGGWASDFAGSFVYQSPRTVAYQWTLNGKAVTGATANTLQAKSAGQYACVVTASNQAGSASQTSASVKEEAAKIKLSVKKAAAQSGGLATFKVNAVNKGDIQSGSARVCVKVPKGAKGDLKAPKCKSLGKLKGHGKRTAKLKVKVGPSADGVYKLTFQVRGSAGKPAKAKLLVH
jgi:hypothetical protein